MNTFPKGLNKLRPGAETRVYNASRYYLFSTPLTNSIAQQIAEPNNDTEIELRNKALTLTKMPQFVFYSSQDEATSRKIWTPYNPGLPLKQPLLLSCD